MTYTVADSWGKALGVPAQNLVIAIVLFSAYPLAALFTKLPAHAATAKHLFSITVATVICVFIVDPWLYVQLLTACVSAWALVAYKRESKWVPITVFLGILSLLSVHHLENQIFNPDESRSDNTGPIMMLVIKLSTFAWAAHDGTKKHETLTKEQQRTAIREMPSLIEFLGYAFFFGGWFVGPANDFADYRKFTRGEAPFDRIPPRTVPAFKTFLVGLFTIGIFMAGAKPLAHIKATYPSFLEQPLWYRIIYITLAGNVVRCKYYGAWKLAEGACAISGISYLGPDPKDPKKQLFTRVQNVDPYALELAQSPRDYIGAWNQQTGKWLRNCVYLRVAPQEPSATTKADTKDPAAKGKKGGGSTAFANFCTYLTSAVWHGFRPGYYFTFLSGAMVTITGQLLRRNLRPLVVQPSQLAPYKPLYDALGWLFTQFSINYICAPFPVYTVANGLKVWRSVYYMVHVWNFAAIVFFGALGGGRICRRVGKALGASYGGHRESGGQAELTKSVADSSGVLLTGSTPKSERATKKVQ
ncbi:MBOAT, membrane-bound O-acyltransferase family-domain-containing protein [Phlyctochytrium arcticum]|nr:MBOAT, membrane-bound O-acyltransferase family-domain-containing protein [Phlyctochytrium arcticum]